MICRESRDALALALRRYVSKRIHNDELVMVIVDKNDRGARAVYRQSWLIYSDLEKHYATGKRAIDAKLRREIACWVLFLQSDTEYLWPDSPFGFHVFAMNILTLDWWGRWRFEKYKAAGDYSVWPFIDARQLQQRAARRRFLSGGGMVE